MAASGANEKMIRLIEQIEDLSSRLNASVNELRALAAGENPTYQVMKHWVSRYGKQYGTKYEFSRSDTGNLKRLALKFGATDMQARIERYLSDHDDFLVRQRHPISILFTRINTYAPVTEPTELEMSAVGCPHNPPCVSRQACTRRRVADLRES